MRDRAGRLVWRIASTIGQFHPGDVSAESATGLVFQLTVSSPAVMAVILSRVGISAQGTALGPYREAPDRRVLSALRIGITGLADFRRTRLPREDGQAMREIDGLATADACISASIMALCRED